MLLRIDRLLVPEEVGLILHMTREEVLALAQRPVGDPLRLASIPVSRKRRRFQPEAVRDWIDRNSAPRPVYADAVGCPAEPEPDQAPQTPRRGRPVK